MPTTVLLAAAMIAAALPVAWWAVAAERGTSRAVAANLRRGLGAADLRSVALSQSGTLRLVKPFAARLRRLTPVTILDRLDRRITAAGLQASWPLERVLGIKLLAAGTGCLVGATLVLSAPGARSLGMTAVLVAGAWFLPDLLLRRRAEERQQAVRNTLPDVVDQLMISVEAGLGIEQALVRVARRVDGPLGEELARTAQDIDLGASRARALSALAERLDVPEVRRVVGAIRHADRYGVPVASALRAQADDLRDRRRQRAEELAKKIPVKVLVPLVFCILPALFVAILGPTAVRFFEG